MGFLKSLWGKSPEDHEKEGDSYFAHKSYGSAKLQYESALEKLKRRTQLDSPYKISLEEKILKTNEALATAHTDEAKDLIQGELFEDAMDLLEVAGSLTQNESLKIKINSLIEEIDSMLEEGAVDALVEEENGEEQFDALLGPLPEAIQVAYLSYGDHFKDGYIALNQGDFDLAYEKLIQAKEDQREPCPHIDFELASACINIGRIDQAEELLQSYISHFPEAMPAYQFLCEIYWEKKAFDSVDTLLNKLSEDLKESESAFVLKGENYYQSEKYQDARKLFERYLNTYGWSRNIGLLLGKVYEMENNIPDALRIYQELMNACQQCGSHIDPFIKRKFANLSFQNGERGPLLLEMYLSLTQEDPDHAAEYYSRVSELYKATGFDDQAKHFSDIAEKIGHKSNSNGTQSE